MMDTRSWLPSNFGYGRDNGCVIGSKWWKNLREKNRSNGGNDTVVGRNVIIEKV